MLAWLQWKYMNKDFIYIIIHLAAIRSDDPRIRGVSHRGTGANHVWQTDQNGMGTNMAIITIHTVGSLKFVGHNFCGLLKIYRFMGT